MMCSWSGEQACFSSMRHRETLQYEIQHLLPRGSAGNCIPLNQGFHGHRNLNPESLTPCVSPWASSRQNPVTNSLAWTLSHRFYSRSLTYAHRQSGKSSWQFSSYLLLPQKDQARLSARIATQTQRPWGQGGRCQLPTLCWGTAGSTGLSACAGTTGTLQPQQHQGVWHQQQRLD